MISQVSALRPGADDALSAHDHAQLLRETMLRSHDLLAIRDPHELLSRVLQDAVDLLDATVARFHPTVDGGGLAPTASNGSTLLAASAVALLTGARPFGADSQTGAGLLLWALGVYALLGIAAGRIPVVARLTPIERRRVVFGPSFAGIAR